MQLYLVMLFVIVFLGEALHPRLSAKRKKIYLWICFIILTLISGLRAYSVGMDTSTYVAVFENIENGGRLIIRYETGFLYFIKLVRFVTANPSVFLFLCSAICIGITCIFVYFHCEEPCFAMTLYILLKAYFFQMTGVRQSLATSFVMIAFSLLLQAKTKKNGVIAALLILLAVSFHSASVVAFIPFIIWIAPKQVIVNKITPNKTLVYSIVFSASAFILYPYIMKATNYLLPQYTLYFDSIWSDSNYSASLFKMLIQFSFLVVGVIYFKRKAELAQEDKLSMLMMIFSMTVGTLAMRMEIWGRLSPLFTIYTAVLWAPAFVRAEDDIRKRRILKMCILVGSFAYMMITFIFRPEWDGVVPYASII